MRILIAALATSLTLLACIYGSFQMRVHHAAVWIPILYSASLLVLDYAFVFWLLRDREEEGDWPYMWHM